MPLKKYFKGRGEEVMEDMQGRYGAKEGKRAFYATANKRKMAPKRRKKSRRPPSRSEGR